MGTTAEKLTYLNTTKSKLKDTINYTGAGIDSNTTFRAYDKKLYNGFADALKDNGKILFNNMPKVTDSGVSVALNNILNSRLKITLTPSEIYQSNTPSPDNPQTVHTISGNNTIKICGKNLFDKTKTTSGKYIDSTGAETSYYAYSLSDYMPVQPNTEYSYQGISAYSEYGAFYDSTKTLISTFIESTVLSNQHITSPNNAQYVRFSLINTNQDINNFQLEKGSSASEYENYKGETFSITLGDLEYCQKDSYIDEFIKTTGKNLLNKELIVSTNTGNWTVTQTGNGVIINHRNQWTTGQPVLNFTLKPNTTYTYSQVTSSNGGIGITPDGGTTKYLSQTGNVLVTTGNSGTIRIEFILSSETIADYTFMQLEEGDATSYEPYGKDLWYLKKNVGKYVFASNETLQTYGTNGAYKIAGKIQAYSTSELTQPLGYCNILEIKERNSLFFGNVNGISYNNTEIFIYYSGKTSSQIVSMLSGNSLYYMLKASTYTLLNDTLQSEFNNIENKMLSYLNETNVFQTNNDLPFIISASAIKKYE